MTLANVQLSRKGRYRVGDKIGEGAMGIVHKVVDTESQEDNKWAVKLTQVPKATKSRRSQPEVRARLLNHERSLYEITFSMLRGSVLPKTPMGTTGLQVYGKDGTSIFSRILKKIWSYWRFSFRLTQMFIYALVYSR